MSPLSLVYFTCFPTNTPFVIHLALSLCCTSLASLPLAHIQFNLFASTFAWRRALTLSVRPEKIAVAPLHPLLLTLTPTPTHTRTKKLGIRTLSIVQSDDEDEGVKKSKNHIHPSLARSLARPPTHPFAQCPACGSGFSSGGGNVMLASILSRLVAASNADLRLLTLLTVGSNTPALRLSFTVPCNKSSP